MIQYKIELNSKSSKVLQVPVGGMFTFFQANSSRLTWVHIFRFRSLREFDIEKLSNCCRHNNDRVSFTTFLNLIFGGIFLFGQVVHRPQNTGGYRLPWVYMIKLYCNAVSVTAFPTNVQPRYQITVGSRFKGQSWSQSFIGKSEILYFIDVINLFFHSFHIIYLKSNYLLIRL